MKKIYSILGILALGTFANAQIVINEVYGGGGNSGSTWKNDFVELINNGSTTATLTGATLQYTSAAGVFNTYQTLPSITLAPGQKYLIQEAAGTGGTTNLPTPDFVGTTLINFNSTTNSSTTGFAMSGTNGKLALVNGIVQITTPTDAAVLDFVGFGSASQFEGTAAAPVMSNTTSDSRTNGVDTNNNSTDFTNGTPTPENKATMSVVDVNNTKVNLVKNTIVNDGLTFGAKATNVQLVNMNGQVVKTVSVDNGTIVNISSLPKGTYIVTADVNGKKVSQKIVKQ